MLSEYKIDWIVFSRPEDLEDTEGEDHKVTQQPVTEQPNGNETAIPMESA